MSTSATATNQSITRITRDEFIQQGLDIVHAYANNCHLSIVFPEHSPAQLAEWIWKRRADKNDTIPLLPQHVAVRLSNGQLRIMDRNSEAKPVLRPAVDEVDCPPMVPPDLDEIQPLPAPFMRFRQEELRATGSSSQGEEEEEFDFPADGLPLERFPSPPDTRSPPILPIRNSASSESSRSPEHETPELDIVYPPQGRTILGLDGQVIDEEKVSPRWLDEMQQQVRNKRRRLKHMLEDSQVELAQAVLEMQKAKSDLDFSVTDSRQTLERLKRLFGTKRILKVLDVVRLGREGKLRKTYFDNIVNEGQESHSPRTSRKRARDDVDDSEAEVEVELSVLHDPESDRAKRRRLDNAARSLPGTKSPAGSQERRNLGSQICRSSQRTRSGEIAKDRRPKREPSVFLTSPSPFRLRHIPEKDREKFAPMIARFGLDKDEPERPSSRRPSPDGHQQMRMTPDTPRRRSLKHSTSRMIPYEGGHLYVKHCS